MRHGDIHTWAPVLWNFLVQRYGVQSMLDVGCGEGHTVLFFTVSEFGPTELMASFQTSGER